MNILTSLETTKCLYVVSGTVYMSKLTQVAKICIKLIKEC
jgi:hypothetical protein